MHLSIEQFSVSLTRSEAVDIFSSVRIGIRHTIVTHWRQHQNCWPDSETQRLNILKELVRVTGHDYNQEFEAFTKLLNNEDEV